MSFFRSPDEQRVSKENLGAVVLTTDDFTTLFHLLLLFFFFLLLFWKTFFSVRISIKYKNMQFLRAQSEQQISVCGFEYIQRQMYSLCCPKEKCARKFGLNEKRVWPHLYTNRNVHYVWCKRRAKRKHWTNMCTYVISASGRMAKNIFPMPRLHGHKSKVGGKEMTDRVDKQHTIAARSMRWHSTIHDANRKQTLFACPTKMDSPRNL